MKAEKIKMRCAAVVACYSFKVGSKYLTIFEEDYAKYKNPKEHKFLLSKEVKNRLLDIRDDTYPHDFRRTYLVLKLVAEFFDEYFIDFERFEKEELF